MLPSSIGPQVGEVCMPGFRIESTRFSGGRRNETAAFPRIVDSVDWLVPWFQHVVPILAIL